MDSFPLSVPLLCFPDGPLPNMCFWFLHLYCFFKLEEDMVLSAFWRLPFLDLGFSVSRPLRFFLDPFSFWSPSLPNSFSRFLIANPFLPSVSRHCVFWR